MSETTAAPKVRNMDELWAWMNTWGDISEKHDGGRNAEWRRGYEQAIEDMLVRFREMGVVNCSDAAWQKFCGRGRKEPS